MRTRPFNILQRIGFRRLSISFAILLSAVMLFSLVLFALIPTIISTTYAQNHLQRLLSARLNRPVSWTRLDISWSDGLAIKGFSLGSGPAPLLKGYAGEAAVVPRIGYISGRVRADLELRIGTVTLELAPGPPKPPKPYKEPLTAVAEALQRFEKISWPLPLDLGVKVAIEPVNLVYSDPRSGRKIALDNFMLRLNMPSLADYPIKAELRGGLAVDGHRQEALEITADLQRLVTVTRHVQPSTSLVAIRAVLPGTTLTVQGGLHEPAGFAARARVDLARAMTVVGPFLPPTLPKIGGEMALDLQAKADPSHNLHADLALNGSRLVLSGGKLRQVRVGPLDLKLRQGIVSDHKRQQVRFADGSATIGTLLTGVWEATVDRPADRDRDLKARLGPVRVDLRQAVDLAAPLLPPRFPLKELTGELMLRELSARLQGRKNQGEVTLAGLGVTVPRLRFALAKGGIAAEGVDVSIDRATLPMAAFKPTKIDAAVSYAVRKCAVTGARPIAADGLRGGVQLAITDIDLKSRSPRKIVATVDLKQSLDLRRVELERKLAVDALQEQCIARIKARDDGEIEVSLPELKLGVATMKVLAKGKELKPLPFLATLSAAGIRLPPTKGASPSLERATCTIASGDALQLVATGGVSSGTPQLATTEGSLKLDLERAIPFAAQFLPKGVAAGGVTAMTWNLAAPVKQQPATRKTNPLAAAKAALSRVDRADITLTLANLAITWPLNNYKVKIGELKTPQPIRLSMPGKGGKIRVDGGIAFTGLSGLPGKVGQLPAQSGSLLMQGELVGWQSLRLHEELRIQPLGLSQQGDAVIGRIDALLEKSDAITTASLLQRLDAVLSADITAKFPAKPTPVPGGVELSGESSAGLRVNLSAGRDLQLRATAKTRDFGLRLKNGTTAEGVRADLLFERTYALAREEAAGWTPLSLSLVHPVPERVTAAGATEVVNRVREDLRGQERGSRKFTIRRIVTTSGKTPLELTSLEGDLLLTPEEMGLSFFQAEVLGGTVRLRSLIDLKPEVPTVSAACSFTNLETFLLLPQEVRKQSRTVRQETEVTGEVSLDAPLLPGQRELLEGVRMRLNLRKIGADTLERALFGLDPFERNEQLVAQRKMLRHGRLKSLRAGTLDGAFSIEGELQVKGVDVSLPKVERIRLSELPIRKQMAKTIAGVTSLRKVLDLVRADSLVVGPKGKIELVRRGHE